MPLYEYECEKCGDVFETLQKFSDTPLAVHEKCGGPVHRLLSTSALMFKGSGWYVNDYAKGANNSKKGESSKGESSESSQSGSGSSGKGDSGKSDSGNLSKSSDSSSSSSSATTASTSSSDKK